MTRDVKLLTHLIAAALCGAIGQSGADAEAPPFISASGGKLYEGEEVFRFVSWNIPNLHNVEDAFEFLGKSPWRWPDEFEIRDALESVRQMGGRVARTYVISVRRIDGDMGDHVHVLAPGEFNEEAFEALDLVLKVADEKGIRVIIPLVDNWRWWGGVRQYEQFRDRPEGSFWTDDQVMADFRKTIEFVLNRRNTLTGVRYRDDPTILAWETGNELDSPPDWTRETAAYLKKLDPNHLVIDGRSLRGLPTESLSDPNVDVVTTHHYPNLGNDAASVRSAIATVGGRKAYFVGEFGFLPIDEAQRVLDAVIESDASGALYWSLRFHRREGGFYWHHEPSGDDLFKSYHWPGFAEGRSYREHLVIPMIRNAAFRIRGLEVPPPPRPAAPKLLDPNSPDNLSWQGSTGATDYDVQRATAESGPWRTIAERVSDAATQYRPLVSDESAKPGVAYFYRVIARNSSGESPPSNVIGPITYDRRLFVDEMMNLDRASSSAGGAEALSNGARRVQEDNHRVKLPSGASVTYQMAGPIAEAQAWVFASTDDQAVSVEWSDDGMTFMPAEPRRRVAPESSNDYGYLRPIHLTASSSPRAARWVRFSTPDVRDGDSVELSRVEIRYEPGGGQGDD